MLAIHRPLFIYVCSFTALAIASVRAPGGHASGSVFDAPHSTLGTLMRVRGRGGLEQAGTEEVLRHAYRHALQMHAGVNACDNKHARARTRTDARRTHLDARRYGTAGEAPRVKDSFVGKSSCRPSDGTEQVHPSVPPVSVPPPAADFSTSRAVQCRTLADKA